MELRRLEDIEEFYALVEPFLLQHEAEHGMMLGALAYLMRYPERIERPPYLAALTHNGEVAACAAIPWPRNLVLSRGWTPDTLPLPAKDLWESGQTPPGVLGPASTSEAFAEAWQALSGQPYSLHMAMRIYRLDAVVPVEGVPGQLRRATAADRDLLIAWLAAFNEEALGETTDTARAERQVDAALEAGTLDIYLWEDAAGRPVTMASCLGPTPHSIRIGGVYTPPEHRRKGYASACVAALSQLLLDGGRTFCTLFTDLANPTSNRIYQNVGYYVVSDVNVYKFSAGAPGE